MHTIEQSNHQQWDNNPEPFERQYSGPVAHILTGYSTGTHKVIRKTGLFTAVVHPNSLWQSNQQTSDILVLTYYQRLDMFSM